MVHRLPTTRVVVTFAASAVGDATDPTERGRAALLRRARRVPLRPVQRRPLARGFRASSVVESPSNWCVPKSVLLTAAARSQGIPARLGFADVRNHLTSEKLKAQMSSDLFVWHGYSELLLDDGWLKLSSAFNIELCERFGVKTLEFDGTGDALMHPFDTAGRQHMEYVRQRGSLRRPAARRDHGHVRRDLRRRA